MKKYRPILLSFLIIVGLAGYISLKTPTTPGGTSLAHAASTCPSPGTLHGWAWSSNIGWISFNCADVSNPPVSYGVSMDNGTGNLSGYAWSSTVGWISFNTADTSGCPSGGCQANISTSTGAVTGWAKILTTNDWLQFSGTNHVKDQTGHGGVTYVSSGGVGYLVGYAWGGPFGWINFNINSSGNGTCVPGATGCQGACISGCGGTPAAISVTFNATSSTGAAVGTTGSSPSPTFGNTLNVSQSTSAQSWPVTISWSASDSAIGATLSCSPSSISGNEFTGSGTSGSLLNLNSSAAPLSVSRHAYSITCSDTSGTSPVTSTVYVKVTTPTSTLIISSCSPASLSVEAGTSVTWGASVSGGTSPYSYLWSFTGSPTVSGATTATPQTVFPAASSGHQWAGTLKVTDSALNTASCSATIGVSGNPVFMDF